MNGEVIPALSIADRPCPRQAMLAAQMQKSADQAEAAVSVVITATRQRLPFMASLYRKHPVETPFEQGLLWFRIVVFG